MLKIDLSKLEESGSIKEIKKKIQLEGLIFRHREIEVPEPLILDLSIYNADKAFVLSGNLKGKLVMECSRCLEKFPYNINLDINDELKKENIKDIKNVDIKEILKNNIYLSLPIKPLCSENCKGLCPECGQNLNYSQCDCDTETIDPRLAKLKDLLDEDDK